LLEGFTDGFGSLRSGGALVCRAAAAGCDPYFAQDFATIQPYFLVPAPPGSPFVGRFIAKKQEFGKRRTFPLCPFGELEVDMTKACAVLASASNLKASCRSK
jgi:hypothetical protein